MEDAMKKLIRPRGVREIRLGKALVLGMDESARETRERSWYYGRRTAAITDRV